MFQVVAPLQLVIPPPENESKPLPGNPIGIRIVTSGSKTMFQMVIAVAAASPHH